MSQTGASALHPSVEHVGTTHALLTHASPSAHVRSGSATPIDAQSFASRQQTAGFGFVQPTTRRSTQQRHERIAR
jgi:hypothetical protein